MLSEIIQSSGLKGSLLTRHKFYDNWGFEFPCSKSFGFHIITQGSCYLRYKGKNQKLEKGDIAFISRGFNHDLVSNLKQKVQPIDSLIKSETQVSQSIPGCTIISVRYEPSGTVHPFFRELPEFIHIDSRDIPSYHPIHSALVLISSEIDTGGNSEIIISRLSDVLLYYVLKYWVALHASSSPGWIKTFKDEKILYVLDLLHKDVSKNWTLDSISDTLGISRASLANKFRDSLGITPLDYLSRIRIEKGKKLLEESNYTLEEVARNVGYSNAFSFSKAYKRIRGVSPFHEIKKNFQTIL